MELPSLPPPNRRRPPIAPLPEKPSPSPHNRNRQVYEIPITHGTYPRLDLRQIKSDTNDFGMMSYEPAFNQHALHQPRFYIDGDKGILRLPRYPIERARRKKPLIRTGIFFLRGELPTETQQRTGPARFAAHCVTKA